MEISTYDLTNIIVAQYQPNTFQLPKIEVLLYNL
jgi:hypothetical protein